MIRGHAVFDSDKLGTYDGIGNIIQKSNMRQIYMI